MAAGSKGKKTILEFKAIGTSESYDVSLDAVSVNAIPIPTASFIFAPALLGFIVLRRKAIKPVA
jgi:hypothetical protein